MTRIYRPTKWNTPWNYANYTGWWSCSTAVHAYFSLLVCFFFLELIRYASHELTWLKMEIDTVCKQDFIRSISQWDLQHHCFHSAFRAYHHILKANLNHNTDTCISSSSELKSHPLYLPLIKKLWRVHHHSLSSLSSEYLTIRVHMFTSIFVTFRSPLFLVINIWIHAQTLTFF